jgi:hypothetical protein
VAAQVAPRQPQRRRRQLLVCRAARLLRGLPQRAQALLVLLAGPRCCWRLQLLQRPRLLRLLGCLVHPRWRPGPCLPAPLAV